MKIEMASGIYLHTKSTIKSTISTFAKGWNNIPQKAEKIWQLLTCLAERKI